MTTGREEVVARSPSNRFAGSILALALILACWAPACDSGTTVSQDLAVDGSDLPDVPDGSLSDAPRDGALDEGSDVDVPKTCENQLEPWLCLDASHCAAWEDCTGPQTCDLPPCWGEYCQDFPGTCVPRLSEVTCTNRSDCAEGQSCPAVVGGASPQPAVCRGLPVVPGACWGDLDCLAGQRCAGETRCAPDRLGACFESPGRCAPAPVGSNCLEYDDCGATGVCNGAVLCQATDSGCADVVGTCAAGPRPGCRTDADCQDVPSAPVCVGVRPEAAGFCSPAPGKNGGECWEDADCGAKGACLSAAPCPPGDRCRAGALHAGFCGPFPPDAPGGVVVTYVPGAAAFENYLRAEDRAVIHNRLPVAIAYPACQALGFQTQRNGEWEAGVFNGQMDDALCPSPSQEMLLRIPAGGSRVLVGLAADFWLEGEGRMKRLVLVYHVGCDSADATAEGCRVLETRSVLSGEFQ